MSYEFQTERLTLRPLTSADRHAFIRFHTISREHLRPWSPTMPDMPLEMYFDTQLERTHRALSAGDALRLIALDRLSGRMAGTFNLNNIVRGVFESADAGWAVSADFIGRGVATEGVTALLDIAFAPPDSHIHGLGLHRVQANIIPANLASLRVAHKCGFRTEGIAIAMLKIAGEWHDHIMHAKLAHEHVK